PRGARLRGMLLSDLLAELRDVRSFDGSRLVGDAHVELTEAAHDSRALEPGSLFCCVTGTFSDGHDHAPAAVAAGAAALLCERPLDLAVPQVIVPSVRAAMGPAAAVLAGHPSRDLVTVGVTGTN